MIIERDFGLITGTVADLPAFDRQSYILVSPALNETHEGRKYVLVTDPLDYQITVNVGTAVTSLKTLTPNPVKNLKPLRNQQLSPTFEYSFEAEAVLNPIFQAPATQSEIR